MAQFNTGATSGYIDIGSVALTVAGSEIPLTGPDGLLGSFKIATLPSGGTAADIVVSAAFALDSTDSVLSPAAFFPGASSGQVAYAFTPDEGGTFRVSIFADGASPSDDDKLDGTGAVATATGSGTADVASAGTLSGVASTAYDGYIAYTDDFGNTEIVGPFDVTSAAAGGGSLTLIEIGVTGELGASGSVGMDFTDVLEGDRIVIMASKGRGNTAGGPTAIVVGGFGATPRMTTDDGSLRTKCLGWDMVATAGMEGNASVVIDYTMTATGFGSTFLSVYAIRGSIATVTALESVKGTGPAPANVRGDLAVNSNGVVLLAAINEDAAADMTMTPTAPLATDLYALNSSAQGNLHASGIPASTETLSVGYDQTDGSAANAHYAMGALAYAA